MFEVIIIAAIAIIVGLLIGYFLMLKVQKGRSKAAAKEAQAIVSDAQREAENMRREALVETGCDGKAAIGSVRTAVQADGSTFFVAPRFLTESGQPAFAKTVLTAFAVREQLVA